MHSRLQNGAPEAVDKETGLVVRAYSGWYDVAVNDRVYEAQPRGRLRRHDDSILTGDRVEVTLNDDGSATVESILPRRNSLLRPAVSNVDQIVIVFSLARPDWSPALTDRIAVLSEAVPLDVLFCINKIDLLDSYKTAARAAEYYTKVGYTVTLADAKQGYGIDDLRAHLRDRVTVFAGESGVGKSTILNALQPSWQLATAKTSQRLGQGRHTTRHTSLLALEEQGAPKPVGYVVDTPGFRRLGVTEVEKYELPWLFPEFRKPLEQCRFDDCLHRSEPGCGVKEAIDDGRVDSARHESYLMLLAEIEEYEANLYR